MADEAVPLCGYEGRDGVAAYEDKGEDPTLTRRER
jgi:hypothetical protein